MSCLGSRAIVARSAGRPGRPRLRGRWVSYSTTGSLQSGIARHAPDHKQGPAPLCLGRGLLWRLLGRRVQALRVPSEKQGAVPTTQNLARRPHPPRCTRISSVYSRSPDADPKQDSKHHFCVSTSSPPSYKGEEAGEKKNFSFHCPARFCSFIPRWVHISAPPSPRL